MSKKYKNKTCVYCGIERASKTADHVIAREFFLKDKRANIPKVPSCDQCNNTKSTLEHYLTTILPFGARHPDAATNLSTMVPKRLAKNAKLHHMLRHKKQESWIKKNGILLPVTTFPIENDKIEKLFCYVVKGLMWHHWKIILPPEYVARAGFLTETGEHLFWNLFKMNANNRVNNILGDGTFQYEGLQGIDRPSLSVWKMELYGGLQVLGNQLLPSNPSIIWALTCKDVVLLPNN